MNESGQNCVFFAFNRNTSLYLIWLSFRPDLLPVTNMELYSKFSQLFQFFHDCHFLFETLSDQFNADDKNPSV